ncbi:hypothetical protein FQA47_018049 [Oryzias melastigma]|uniref:Uncharacterized protein n=1 Tax=Oryzias melastigma TaxID=30732 RepID=A0A834C1G5_ORYME|nr:hypothetical protein FQA47_018049 [Oryzias melastigma]
MELTAWFSGGNLMLQLPFSLRKTDGEVVGGGGVRRTDNAPYRPQDERARLVGRTSHLPTRINDGGERRRAPPPPHIHMDIKQSLPRAPQQTACVFEHPPPPPPDLTTADVTARIHHFSPRAL